MFFRWARYSLKLQTLVEPSYTATREVQIIQLAFSVFGKAKMPNGEQKER